MLQQGTIKIISKPKQKADKIYYSFFLDVQDEVSALQIKTQDKAFYDTLEVGKKITVDIRPNNFVFLNGKSERVNLTYVLKDIVVSKK